MSDIVISGQKCVKPNLSGKREEMKGRQLEFDLAKTLAVFFMVLIHTADNMSTVTANVTPVSILLDFLGGPLAAPVFMFAMGVGMVYTRHDQPEDFMKRGLHLLLTGYILNFFRETILILAAHILNIDTVYDKSLIDTIGTVDILQFAGMAFLIMALLKKWNVDSCGIALAALFMQTIGNLTTGMFTGIPKIFQYILGLLFYTNEYISFPILLWFIYPAAGYCFGTYLKNVKDKAAFYMHVSVTSLVLFLAVSCTAETVLPYFMGQDYYVQNLFSTVWILSIVMMFLSLCYFITKRMNRTWIDRIITISKNTNRIYIIQWLLITYLIAVRQLLGYEYISDAMVLPFTCMITIGSVISSNMIRRKRE